VLLVFSWPYYRLEDEIALTGIFIFIAMMADLVYRSRAESYSALFSSIGALVMAVSFVAILTLESWGFLQIYALLISFAWALLGYMMRSRVMTVSGGVILAGICIHGFVTLVAYINLNNWLILSVLGGIAIVMASLSERYAVIVTIKFKRLFSRLSKTA